MAGAFRGQYNLAGGMATTGSLTRWYRDNLAVDLPPERAHAMMCAEAAGVRPGAAGLLVMPYFGGEHTPVNEPLARGVIAGLSLSHFRDELYRAVLEGVAYGIRHNLETFASIGAYPRRIVAVGGGTQTAEWLQVVSDVAGVDQVVPEIAIGASYGDAFLAGLASGMLSDDDIGRWAVPERQIHPRQEALIVYEAYCSDYLELYHATRDIVHRLASRGR